MKGPVPRPWRLAGPSGQLPCKPPTFNWLRAPGVSRAQKGNSAATLPTHNHLRAEGVSRPQEGNSRPLSRSIALPGPQEGLPGLPHQHGDLRAHQVHGGLPVDGIQRIHAHRRRRILHHPPDHPVLLVVMGIPPPPFSAGLPMSPSLALRIPANPLSARIPGIGAEPLPAVPAMLQLDHPDPLAIPQGLSAAWGKIGAQGGPVWAVKSIQGRNYPPCPARGRMEAIQAGDPWRPQPRSEGPRRLAR